MPRILGRSSFAPAPAFLVLAACLSASLGASLSGCKPRESGAESERAWNQANDPVILRGNRKLERRYSKLPKSESVAKSRMPWPDTHWPSRFGGIAARWNSVNPFAFGTVQPSQANVQNMTLAQRATLSPAEKYDIYMGNYAFPLTVWEKQRTSPTALEWEGLCHGTAAASLLYEEPKPVVVKNAEGLDVPFGSSDIKGLLALYLGYIATNNANYVGQRCNRPLPSNKNGTDAPVNVGAGFGRESLTECEDVNAGSFHLVLGNVVGLQEDSVIADLTEHEEVWNHAIVSYNVKEKGERSPQPTAAPGTVKEKILETEVSYMVRGVPAWKRENARLPDSIEKVVYRYAIELNKDGEIIGGEWLQAVHPDFLWKQSRPEFQFYFHKMKELVEASRKSEQKDDLTYR